MASEGVLTSAAGAPTIGFVGVGTINAAVVVGLLKTANPPRVVLSPRNYDKVKQLRDKFPDSVTVAASNQDVVDRAPLVFVAVLPQQHVAVLRDLKFTAQHTVVSLMAGVNTKQLRTVLSPELPDERIVRAVPLPPVKDHAGCTLVYPPNKIVVEIFEQLGGAVPCDDETKMTIMMSMTYMMGPYYRLLASCQVFLQTNGIEPAVASQYVGSIMKCIASDGKKIGDTGAGFEGLVAEQTPGGYNEQGIRELTKAGVWEEFEATLMSLVLRTFGRAKRSEMRPMTTAGQRHAILKQKFSWAHIAAAMCLGGVLHNFVKHYLRQQARARAMGR